VSETQDVVGVGFMVAAFTDVNSGDEALKALKDAKKQKQIYFDDAAVIRQDEDGDVHYRETGDMTTGKGAGIGALVGGVIGILGGPVGIVVGAGAGALIGGAASHGDAGFDDDSLEQIGVALRPGTSALLATTDKYFVEMVNKQIGEEDLRTAIADLSAGLVAKLDEGKDVVLRMLLTEEGIAIQQVDADDQAVHVLGAIFTEDAVVAGEAVVTEDGAAYQVGVATEEGVVTESGVITDDAAAVVDTVTTDEGTIVVGDDVEVVPEEEQEPASDSEKEA
jgi:uncharacterized membrane protein